MGKSAKKIIQNNNQTKSMGSQKRDNELVQENTRKPLNSKETISKGSDVRAPSSPVVIDKNVGTEPPEVNENLVIHYMDGAYGSKDGIPSPKAHEVAAKDGKDDDILDDHSDELDKELKKVSEEQSDLESITDSASSQGDSGRADDDKIEDSSRTSRKPAKKVSSEIPKRVSRERFDPDESTSQFKHITPKKPMKSSNSKVLAKGSDNLKPKNTRAYSTSKSSERLDEKPDEKANGETPNETKNGVRTGETDGEDIHAEAKEQTSDGASNGGRSIETDSGLDHANDIVTHQEAIVLKEKVESMQKKIEKLEEELREVAALEISLYSVIPEHGSSAHKVHTPARRLSRLYIHACKHWTQSKRATVARNTVSGLILVTRTCGNDVARLTFWLSNTVVLRKIISQAFGSSSQSNPMRFIESSGGASLGNGSSLKMLGNSGVKTVSKSNSFTKDWQETRTFLGALEEVESWIFSRVVESVWWQALAPNMQYLVEDLISHKNIGRCLGPALGDQQQGSFSVELWRNAFQDAFQRTCPVRAGGHECGCLPVLARMVMEQCVSRLDVAMFNAILRESANQIPMDPVSDPIVDARVLPIPAGDLSFGSGAQLKNSVGNWCRWLSDFLGMETGHHSKDHQSETKDDNQQIGRSKTKCFSLLNELSELLMLPKDMLMDLSIRKEVCPSISLSLMKRVLCNFSPDEFCPDPVPGEVLEALNAESVVERRLSGDTEGGFPYTASPVIYSSPSSADVAEKVAEAGGKRHIERNASMIQKKGYTSDEELDDLGSPLASFIEKLPSSPSSLPNGNAVIKPKDQTSYGGNSRYELLREVWSV